MCRSMAEGGQRCSAHTRPKFEAAPFGTPEWDEAAAEHASTRAGATEVEALADAAEQAGNVELMVAACVALESGERLRTVSEKTRALLGSPSPLSKEDVKVLSENKGVFEDGYTDEDALAVLGQLTSARVYVMWDYDDEHGPGGGSEFVGDTPSGRTYAIHPDVWAHLSDPESTVDLDQIPSLLSEDPVNKGEWYSLSSGSASLSSGDVSCYKCGVRHWDDAAAECPSCGSNN